MYVIEESNAMFVENWSTALPLDLYKGHLTSCDSPKNEGIPQSPCPHVSPRNPFLSVDRSEQPTDRRPDRHTVVHRPMLPSNPEFSMWIKVL